MGAVEVLYFLPLSGSWAPGCSKAQNMSVLRCFKTPNSRGRGVEGGGRGRRRRDKGKKREMGGQEILIGTKCYMYKQTRQRCPIGSVGL